MLNMNNSLSKISKLMESAKTIPSKPVKTKPEPDLTDAQVTKIFDDIKDLVIKPVLTKDERADAHWTNQNAKPSGGKIEGWEDNSIWFEDIERLPNSQPVDLDKMCREVMSIEDVEAYRDNIPRHIKKVGPKWYDKNQAYPQAVAAGKIDKDVLANEIEMDKAYQRIRNGAMNRLNRYLSEEIITLAEYKKREEYIANTFKPVERLYPPVAKPVEVVEDNKDMSKPSLTIPWMIAHASEMRKLELLEASKIKKVKAAEAEAAKLASESENDQTDLLFENENPN